MALVSFLFGHVLGQQGGNCFIMARHYSNGSMSINSRLGSAVTLHIRVPIQMVLCEVQHTRGCRLKLRLAIKLKT